MRSLLRLEEGWLTFGFLALMVLSAVWSVEEAAWVQNIGILTWVTLLALACGLIWSRLRWPEWLHHLSATLLGLATVAVFVANGLAGYGYLSFGTKLRILLATVADWARVVWSGDVGTDNSVFLALLALTAWLVGYLGAWTVFREHGAWWPILCSGSALVVNQSYAPVPWWHFMLYLVSSLLLLVKVNLMRQQQTWRYQRIWYSPSLGWGVLRAGVLVSLLAVLASWVAPTVSASGRLADALSFAQDPWDNAQMEFNRLFGGVQSRNLEAVSGFSSSLVPRGSFRLADTVVMHVTADKPLYWRVIVYDRYTGQGWLEPERLQTFYLDADEEALVRLEPEAYARRAEAVQEYRLVLVRGNLLAAAADVERLSIPVRADLANATGGAESGLRGEVVSLRSGVRLRPGLQYTVVSSVSIAEGQLLRQAGTDYPGWVARYLQLPPELPQRVKDLAVDVTQGQDNPYDKALAIERFIRSFPYSQDTVPPPRGRDWVDYLLFDLRQGYCDYFASAMAVMLREVGIPARVASGYATGDWDPQGNRYLVRDSHAHSWVEAYFPQYGWVTFEPSGYRNLPPRQEAASPSVWPTPGASPEHNEPPQRPEQDLPPARPPAQASGPSLGSWAPMALPLGLGLGALAICGLAIWLAWNLGLQGLTGAELAYGKLSQLATWLGLRRGLSQTPHEYADRLAQLVPGQEASLREIVSAFVSYRFGRREPASEQVERLHLIWKEVRWPLVLARIFGSQPRRS